MTGDSEFLEILERKNIDTKFQPILDIQSGNIIGFEAFAAGPKNSSFSKSKDLILMAKKYDKLWDFEVAVRTSAFGEANSYLNDKLLFLNVEPVLLEDCNFQEGFTKAHFEIMNINPSNLVFQISQKTIVEDYERFKVIHSHYKKSKV